MMNGVANLEVLELVQEQVELLELVKENEIILEFCFSKIQELSFNFNVYELVYDLIKISILENDTSFIRLKDLLQNINDDFIFQEKEYIKNL